MKKLLLSLVLVVTVGGWQSSFAQSSTQRIERPLKGGVSAAKVQSGTATDAGNSQTPLKGTLDTNAFELGARTTAAPAAADSSKFPSGAISNPSNVTPKPLFQPMDKFFEEARQARLDGAAQSTPINAADGSGNKPSSETENADDWRTGLKTIIIRVTGFNEDTEITPKINFDAFSMANKLLETRKRKCVILLERTGVKLATTGYTDMAVNGNLVDFRKLIKSYMAAGGEVAVNKKWCDEFSVQSRDMIGGVQV